MRRSSLLWPAGHQAGFLSCSLKAFHPPNDGLPTSNRSTMKFVLRSILRAKDSAK
jgi:hypothetical protein